MSSPSRFLERLAAGPPLLLDAGMGTRLIASGLDLATDNPALWNRSHPEVVAEIHRRDLAAGAAAIVTNTFGANAPTLARFGEAGNVEELIERAVRLARAAAGPDRFVIGDVGPCPDGHAGEDQARALAECGVDAILFEIFQPRQALEALERLRGRVNVPCLVSVYHWERDEARLARALLDAGAVALGFNCVPPSTALSLLEALRRDVPEGVPLLVKPSAQEWDEPPEPIDAFVRALPRSLELGVRLIGGCCGTTEAHIAALRQALDESAGVGV